MVPASNVSVPPTVVILTLANAEAFDFMPEPTAQLVAVAP